MSFDARCIILAGSHFSMSEVGEGREVDRWALCYSTKHNYLSWNRFIPNFEAGCNKHACSLGIDSISMQLRVVNDT